MSENKKDKTPGFRAIDLDEYVKNQREMNSKHKFKIKNKQEKLGVYSKTIKGKSVLLFDIPIDEIKTEADFVSWITWIIRFPRFTNLDILDFIETVNSVKKFNIKKVLD